MKRFIKINVKICDKCASYRPFPLLTVDNFFRFLEGQVFKDCSDLLMKEIQQSLSFLGACKSENINKNVKRKGIISELIILNS